MNGCQLCQINNLKEKRRKEWENEIIKELKNSEKSEEEKEEIKENNNNDYWNDLINERNVTLKNNGNCDYLRIYNILIIFFICLKFLI